MTNLVRSDIRKSLPQRIEVGKDDDGGKRHKDPWPGSQCVMGHIEEQRGAHGVVLVFGREHPLGNVTSPTWLCPRIIA